MIRTFEVADGDSLYLRFPDSETFAAINVRYEGDDTIISVKPMPLSGGEPETVEVTVPA